MKSIFSLGIFLYLIISSKCADDCSSKTTEAACTGSCKWNAGTEATCKPKATCSLNSGKTACTSAEGCQFTAAVTREPTCAPACAANDASTACTEKGCTHDGTNCVVPTCTVSGNACSASGCTYTAGSNTPAKCEATATCALNNDKTACASATGCTFTAAVAGSCTAKTDDDDNSSVLKVSLISLMFFFSLF
jgi:hypothetical protein